MSSNITESNGAFIETDATIEIDGHSFSSGGGWLAKRADTGKYEGILYAYNDSMVGSWDGSIKIPASFTNTWVSNMGDTRQNVYFTHEIDGEKRYFHGVYMKSGSDIVRCKEVKNWEN